MRKTFEAIAIWKKIDAVFQLVLFIPALWLGMNTVGWYGVLILPSGQLLSSILWLLIFKQNIPATKFGRAIRRIYIISPLFLIIFLPFGIMPLFFTTLWFVYFISTIYELHYYSNARKPYYLL